MDLAVGCESEVKPQLDVTVVRGCRPVGSDHGFVKSGDGKLFWS